MDINEKIKNELFNKIKKGAIEKNLKNVKNEVTPFLDGIRILGAMSKEFQTFKKNYLEFTDKYKEKQKIISRFIDRNGERFKIPISEKEIDLLFMYLGLIESVGNTLVDIIIMLIVANGIDFHIECRNRRIKHTTSIKDLEKERVPLSYKMEFLEDNGIKTLTSIIDSHIRNQIAHLSFTIKQDKIYVKNKKNKEKLAIPLVFENIVTLLFASKDVEDLLISLADERKLDLVVN